MRVPYKPVYFTKVHNKFKYIIIHDFTCRFGTFDKALTDDKKLNVADVRSYNWVFNGEFDLPYHFVCKRVGSDFETILSRPLSFTCDFPDIPDQYEHSIHIAIAGNYNLITAETRAYQNMGYRSIASMMKWFAIPIANILMHWEVSNDNKLHCPGDSFDKNKLMALIRPLILVKR